jgi:CBS domain-containing protein
MAKKETPLKDVLKTMSEKHLHRLWVVDDEKKVIDVISLTDLMGLFSKVDD